ncbi:MAG: O-antigen ligase family protein [Rhodospirillaceae bacterium]|nr:O-antigen ligase family protein [Rhodospirillaceae bacterium]
MSRSTIVTFSALFFVPLVTWFKDAAVAVLALGVLASLLSHHTVLLKDVLSSVKTPAGMLACLFVLWSLLSLLWAPSDPALAWTKAFTAIALGFVLAVALSRVSAEAIERIAGAVLIAIATLLGLLLVERITNGFLVGLVRSSETTDQLLNAMNGGLVLLCCCSFSAAGLMRVKTKSWINPALFLASVILVTASYRMDAVPVAVGAGLISFLIVYRWGASSFVALAVLIGIGAVSWPTLSSFATASEFHVWFTETIHPNWGYRITIWSRVSEFIGQNPLIGYGFDSSRIVGGTAGLLPDPAGRTSFLHPHNGLLQVWLELGFIGVLLFLATAAFSLRRILESSPKPLSLAVAAGTMTASATIWLLSFGIWQGGWLAVLGLTVSNVVLCFRLDGESAEAQASSAS